MTRHANKALREYAKLNSVFLYEIADELGISDTSLTKRMRRELPEAESAKIYAIIQKIRQEHMNYEE